MTRIIANPLNNEEEKRWFENIQSRMGDIKISFSYEKDIENAALGKYRPVISRI